MDFYQGVVMEYLRANRATFINPEFLLQLDAGPPLKGRSWYVDVLAVSLQEKAVYLCEVTYAQGLNALLKRLNDWTTHWTNIREALKRDAGIDLNWPARPWVFIPEALIERFKMKLPKMPCIPRVTPLEMCQPWRFCTWNHPKEHEKPACIPPEMCV